MRFLTVDRRRAAHHRYISASRALNLTYPHSLLIRASSGGTPVEMGEGETHTALVTRIADLPSAMCPNIVASVYLRGQAESRPSHRRADPRGGRRAARAYTFDVGYRVRGPLLRGRPQS